MDNDAQMLEVLGNSVIDLMVKYRSAPILDRIAMKPQLEELTNDYVKFQLRLIKEGIVTTNEDLAEMNNIKAEIEKAAKMEQLIKAAAKTIAFISTKVV